MLGGQEQARAQMTLQGSGVVPHGPLLCHVLHAHAGYFCAPMQQQQEQQQEAVLWCDIRWGLGESR